MNPPFSRCAAERTAIAMVLAAAALHLPAGVLRAGERSSAAAAAPVDTATRTALAWQIALEAHGYSPGLVDGVPGRKTRLAIAAVQATLGVPVTGREDADTARFLKVDPEHALASYRVTAADASEIDPPPADWLERSRRKRLAYASLDDLIRERFHTSRALLCRLNPSASLAALRPGDELRVPAVVAPARRARPPVRLLEIDLERRVILLLRGDAAGHVYLEGLLHCSIAARPGNAPAGTCRVASVVEEPVYTFDPAKWPEVHGVERRLRIPPGPRSPVGSRWIGLDRPGIGIHGSPEPENIGKTGSHGCFRLANWDAVWLAALVSPGTTVRIISASSDSSWPWRDHGAAGR